MSNVSSFRINWMRESLTKLQDVAMSGDAAKRLKQHESLRRSRSPSVERPALATLRLPLDNTSQALHSRGEAAVPLASAEQSEALAQRVRLN